MHWSNRLTSHMKMIPTIQSWAEIRTESCKENMGRFYETSLYWPLPIGFSFGLFTIIALDLTIPLIFECHSNIHCNLIVIMINAIDCLKRIRGVGSKLSLRQIRTVTLDFDLSLVIESHLFWWKVVRKQCILFQLLNLFIWCLIIHLIIS